MVLFIIGQHKLTIEWLPGKCKPWRQTNSIIWESGLAFRVDQRNTVSSLNTHTVFTAGLEHNRGCSCPLGKPIVRPSLPDVGMMSKVIITDKLGVLCPCSRHCWSLNKSFPWQQIDDGHNYS